MYRLSSFKNYLTRWWHQRSSSRSGFSTPDMRGARRLPSTYDALCSLKDRGVPVGSVLDVGVLTGTPPLIRAFPSLRHLLFEPVELHHDSIRRNYRNVDHQLYSVALSDEDGEAFVACRAINDNGVITHAELIESRVTPDTYPGLVKCVPTPKARLDTLLEHGSPPKPFLLKIDVDGHEMAVLRGASSTLKNTAIVVVEAPLNRSATPSLFERSSYLLEQNFHLMDIVELAYYDGVLWQADLIFVHDRFVSSINRLRPFESEGFRFDRDLWYPYSDKELGG